MSALEKPPDCTSAAGTERGDEETLAEQFERDAARSLADALESMGTLREPGQRDRHRRLLEGAIEHARRALAEAEDERRALDKSEPVIGRERNAATVVRARTTLAKASAAKAEDALHGAGQLSLSAQRAPTLEACDDGWQRVEGIVLGAEASARLAATTAAELEHDTPGSVVAQKAAAAARDAAAAARAARRIVDERNSAYTFHADSAFSFGEGWYVAAAAVLAGVAIQIEPGRNQTLQAERFLRDAGLDHRLRPYRSRPRAMKHTTELVGRAFRADPMFAQHELREAFLGDAPIPSAVRDWVDRRLATESAGKKVLLWIRDGVHHAARNTRRGELLELVTLVRKAGLVPVVTGDALRDGLVPDGAVDLILFWKDPVFQGADMRRAQLQFFEHLRERHALVGQLGVTTAGMDGPALLGLPTMYVTDAPNVRMREWVSAVPGYQEIVRESGYLEHVSRVLAEWGLLRAQEAGGTGS